MTTSTIGRQRSRQSPAVEPNGHNGRSVAAGEWEPAPGAARGPHPAAVRPVDRCHWHGLALYFAIWVAFILLRIYGGRTPIAHALATADAQLERRLFGGELPTVYLQRHFFTPGHLHWYDYLATSLEWSFFVAPHAIAVFLWRRRPARFRRFVRATGLMLGLGLLIYYLLPSEPPWYLAGGGVTRIMAIAGHDLLDGFFASIDHTVGESNPIAAMPSIHFATIFLIALAFWSEKGIARLLTAAYAALMGLALVYLGEHYVLDLAIAALITGYSWALSRQWAATTRPMRPPWPGRSNGHELPEVAEERSWREDHAVAGRHD